MTFNARPAEGAKLSSSAELARAVGLHSLWLYFLYQERAGLRHDLAAAATRPPELQEQKQLALTLHTNPRPNPSPQP